MESVVLVLYALVIQNKVFGSDLAPTKCISYLEQDSLYTYDDLENYSSNADVELSDPKDSNVRIESFVRNCPPDYKFCFSLWQASSSGSEVVKQGCWKDISEQSLCKQSQCISSHSASHNKSLHYCCCMGNSCNQKFMPMEVVLQNFSDHVSHPTSRYHLNANNGFKAGYFIVLVISIVGILVTLISCQHINRSKLEASPISAHQQLSEHKYTSNSRNVDNINLLCIIGNGKYGTVMKGRLHDKDVAVKIYSEEHYHYFINERNIYSLPHMDTSSFLKYLGSDEHITLEGRKEYLLILSLASLGNLQDWLISNTMNVDTFTQVTKSITNGLSHLHTEIRTSSSYKPSVVHRDFTSRNILVKPDLTCCIADFGFALKVFGSKYECKGETFVAELKSISEVGTLRYMAPELLEGAVNLKDCETSLKQMDVYALGLVIWEVAIRCTSFYSSYDQIPLYKAPYQLEVGLQPTFDQMQNMVARNKVRPSFPEGWGVGSVAKIIKETCEDCWDHDPDARLTSICVSERIRDLIARQKKVKKENEIAIQSSNKNYKDNNQCQRTDFSPNPCLETSESHSFFNQDVEYRVTPTEKREKFLILQNKRRTQHLKYDTISNFEGNINESFIQIFEEPKCRPNNLQIKHWKNLNSNIIIDSVNVQNNLDFINQNNTNRTTTKTDIDSNLLLQNPKPSNDSKPDLNSNKEKFLEIFVGKTNYHHLRNPSQRVKTPGDVPPSVRKIRASKTLSLYDDRMMQSSNFQNV